ncbi:MAG TPA: hypothetical protein VFM03_00310 [Candidatus Limnocylindria bacterium]|nr:hypothetical protein [Candidatus Limnocylindria bacterium]
MAGARTRVALEVAPGRSFASALDWPGWARSGKTPEEALDRLLEYAPRYTAALRGTRLGFAPPASADALEVVERLEGGGSTEFGVPGSAARAEARAMDAAALDRSIAILRAAWRAFDRAADAAGGATLTTGPRGGGRTLDKMRSHVLDAEVAYLGQLGSRPPALDGDLEERMERVRTALVATLTARVRGDELPNPRRTKTPWSPAYAVRRIAWHALDHAWELEDRTP